MQKHAASIAPQEACGLLAGRIVASRNALPSRMSSIPTRFRMEAQSQLDAFLIIEKLGIDLLRITTPPLGGGGPSAIDIAEFL